MPARKSIDVDQDSLSKTKDIFYWYNMTSHIEFTDRELDVAELVASGLVVKQIAIKLDLVVKPLTRLLSLANVGGLILFKNTSHTINCNSRFDIFNGISKLL